MTELQNPYVAVTSGNKITYGGNQGMSDSPIIQKCGCGVVASADVIIYLRKPSQTPPLTLEKYNKFLRFLNRHYLPLIPKFGLNPLVLSAGVNLYFRKRKMPYKASWLCSGEKLYSRIETQLSDNIPVILSVGTNFPCFWQKNNLNLYSKLNNSYIKASSARAHFVTATGIDSQYIRISSWGRELYISKSEFKEYIHAHSNSFLCNMLKISRT